MEIFTLEEWEKNFDELFSRVENGESIGIVKEDGQAAVMMPADDELIRIHTEHKEFLRDCRLLVKPTAYNGVNRVQFPTVLPWGLAIW